MVQEAGEEPRVVRRLYAIAAAAALLCAFLLALFPCRSDDVFMHLAVGRRFFQNGAFPDPDPFLFSLRNYYRGWSDVWGAHLGIYAIHAAAGWSGLVLVKASLVVAGAAAPLWLARRLRYRSFLVPAVLLLALWAASDRFVERSSLLSDVLGAWVVALCWAESERPGRLRWVLPFMFLVWTNVHFGVLTGLFVVGAAAAARPREWRRGVPLFLACLAASCAHPQGPARLFWAIRGVLGDDFRVFRQHYFEFMPTFSELYRGTTQVGLFCALAAVLGVLILLAARRRPPWFAALVWCGLAWLGISGIRYVTTASLSFAPLAVGLGAAVRLGSPEPSGPRRAHRALAPAAMACTALLGAALCLKVAVWGYSAPSTGPRRLGMGLDARVATLARSADFVKALPLRGGIFNEHQLGAYLAWRWDGEPRIFYHGYVLDPAFFERDYLGVARSPEEFQRIVAEYDLAAFYLEMQPPTLIASGLVYRLLLTLPEWRLVYWDAQAMVFVGDRPEHREIVRRLEFRYFQPFHQDRLELGMRTDPQRVLEEAVRVLRVAPEHGPVRTFIRERFGKDPDQLLRERGSTSPAAERHGPGAVARTL